MSELAQLHPAAQVAAVVMLGLAVMLLIWVVGELIRGA